MLNFRQRELQWNNEQVHRFWSWMANEPGFSSEYFARVFGNVLIHYAKKHGLSGHVLDYGCGRGDLVRLLSDSGFQCVGYDPANGDSLPTGTFDFVFFIETIEHLDDKELDSCLTAIRGLLSPGGKVFITTPYRERLGIGKTMCPDCGAVFHRMQHVRSWSEESIQKTMSAYGFETLACWGTTFMKTPLETRLIALYREVKARLFGGQPLRENLIYVGRRC